MLSLISMASIKRLYFSYVLADSLYFAARRKTPTIVIQAGNSRTIWAIRDASEDTRDDENRSCLVFLCFGSEQAGFLWSSRRRRRMLRFLNFNLSATDRTLAGVGKVDRGGFGRVQQRARDVRPL